MNLLYLPFQVLEFDWSTSQSTFRWWICFHLSLFIFAFFVFPNSLFHPFDHSCYFLRSFIYRSFLIMRFRFEWIWVIVLKFSPLSVLRECMLVFDFVDVVSCLLKSSHCCPDHSASAPCPPDCWLILFLTALSFLLEFVELAKILLMIIVLFYRRSMYLKYFSFFHVFECHTNTPYQSCCTPTFPLYLIHFDCTTPTLLLYSVSIHFYCTVHHMFLVVLLSSLRCYHLSRTGYVCRYSPRPRPSLLRILVFRFLSFSLAFDCSAKEDTKNEILFLILIFLLTVFSRWCADSPLTALQKESSRVSSTLLVRALSSRSSLITTCLGIPRNSWCSCWEISMVVMHSTIFSMVCVAFAFAVWGVEWRLLERVEKSKPFVPVVCVRFLFLPWFSLLFSFNCWIVELLLV